MASIRSIRRRAQERTAAALLDRLVERAVHKAFVSAVDDAWGRAMARLIVACCQPYEVMPPAVHGDGSGKVLPPKEAPRPAWRSSRAS